MLSTSHSSRRSLPWIIGLLIVGLLGSAPAVWCDERDDYIQRRIEQSLARNWSHKRIAAGENGPRLNLEESRRQTLLVLLHEGIPPSAIARHEHWSDQQLQAGIEELVQSGLLREISPGVFLPTVLVMSVGEVARSMPVDPLLVERASDLIRARLPELQQRYGRLESASEVPFESASLFLLSNVMLDNWQIRNVESRVLQAERPLRQGGRFYYSIQEDLTDGREAFSIYGNHVRSYGDRVVGVYGNQREENPANFHLLTKDRLDQLFGPAASTQTVDQRKRQLTELFLKREPGARAGFEQLGWLKGGRSQVLTLRMPQLKQLDSMAELVTSDLVNLLLNHRPALERLYRNSPYSEEVSFNEYFLWWYHLFYSAVTDHLYSSGVIKIPASGISTYLVIP